jgi:DNA-nicking Smr family endonuclease
MTGPRTTENFRPFAGLSELLRLREKADRKEKRKLRERDSSAPSCHDPADTPLTLPEHIADKDLFRHVAGDVVPFPAPVRRKRKKQRRRKGIDADHEVRAALQSLVQKGHGFVVRHTPEYMEGRGYGVSPQLARRLHNGDFSIQAHIDLHGLGVQDAFLKVDGFLNEAVRSGLRAVLIIHGRGLSSPGQPVLKEKLRLWLSTGRWRKWVLAFTSARAEDGGAGATYVLLRKKPVSKSQRRGFCFVR